MIKKCEAKIGDIVMVKAKTFFMNDDETYEERGFKYLATQAKVIEANLIEDEDGVCWIYKIVIGNDYDPAFIGSEDIILNLSV